MSKLDTSKGFVMYDELCEELGATVVDSFIEHNILHLRPIQGDACMICQLHFIVSHFVVCFIMW